MSDTETKTNTQAACPPLTDVLAAEREQLYSAQWDAYYYTDTGEWAEERCSDLSCEFCANRPDRAFGG